MEVSERPQQARLLNQSGDKKGREDDTLPLGRVVDWRTAESPPTPTRVQFVIAQGDGQANDSQDEENV